MPYLLSFIFTPGRRYINLLLYPDDRAALFLIFSTLQNVSGIMSRIGKQAIALPKGVTIPGFSEQLR